MIEEIIEIEDAVAGDLIEIVSAGTIPGPQGPIGPTGGISAVNTTKLSISATKPTESVYSVTSNGTGYVHSGDDGALGISEVAFNSSCGILIFLNGINQYKGTDVIWVSETSFQLNSVVDNGDEILIIS